MARTLVALAGALALVSIALVLWFSNGADPGPRALVETNVSSGAQRTEDTELTRGAAGTVGAAATESAVAEGRRALVGTPEAARDHTGRTFQILCIDRATGAPVPAASVFVSHAPTFDGVDVASLPRPARTVREHGTAHVADLDGVVEIERPVRPTHIAAWSGEQSGFVRLELPIIGRVATVALEPVRELTVDVRDASGAPVGGIQLDVGIRGIDRDGKELGQSTSVMVSTSDGSGGELGRVTVDWSAFLARIGRSFPMVGFVEVDWWSADAQRITFDAGDLPAEPLVLTLAESGQLTVELRDAHGELVPGRHPIAFSDSAGRGSSVTAFTNGGRAQFQRVELDRGLMVRAMNSTFGSDAIASGAGPTTALRNAVVELDIEEALIIGRVVDETGQPLSGSTFLESPRGADDKRVVATDSEGRFAFMRRGRVTEVDGGREMQFDLVEGRWSSSSPRTAAIDHRLSAEDSDLNVSQRTTDVGDVVFAHGPLLVQGRVVDSWGTAVPRVGVAVYEVVEGEWKRSRVGAGTSEDGRFTIHGNDALVQRARAGELALYVDSSAFRVKEPVTFAPGADLELTVRSYGRVAGRVAGIDPSDFMSLTVYARSDTIEGPTHAREGFGGFVDRSGGFAFDLAPGDWTLELSRDTGDTERTLDLLECIEVLEGRSVDDSRLDPWEPPVQRMEVSIVDEEGAPVDRGTVWIDTGDDRVERVEFGFGKLWFYAADVPPDLWIFGDDYASALVRAAYDGLVVTLAEAPTVEIVVNGPELDLPDFWTLGLEFELESSKLDGALPVAVHMEPFASVPVEERVYGLHSTGRWVVRLHVASDDWYESVPVGSSWNIDVRGGSELQRFPIVLEQSHINAALEVLRDWSDDD